MDLIWGRLGLRLIVPSPFSALVKGNRNLGNAGIYLSGGRCTAS